ncbi:MAG: hypothetical protein AAFR63_15450 [Cyanobacteria bacterium J06631_6]
MQIALAGFASKRDVASRFAKDGHMRRTMGRSIHEGLSLLVVARRRWRHGANAL